MYLGRMHLLLQRLKRNRNFSRPAFAGIKAASRDYVEVEQALIVACGGLKSTLPVLPSHFSTLHAGMHAEARACVL